MVTRRKKRKSKSAKNKRKKSKHFIIKARRGGGREQTYVILGEDHKSSQSQTTHTDIMENGRQNISNFRSKYENSKLRDIYRNAWDIIFLVSELHNIKKVFDTDAFTDIIKTTDYSDIDDDYDYYDKYQMIEDLMKANKRIFSSAFYSNSEKVKKIKALKQSIYTKTYDVIDFLRHVVIKLIKLRHDLNEAVITTLQNEELISIFEQVLTTLCTLPNLLGNAFGIDHPTDYQRFEKLEPPFNYTDFREILNIYIKTFDFIRKTILSDSKSEMHMRHTRHQQEYFDETKLPENFFTDGNYEYIVD